MQTDTKRHWAKWAQQARPVCPECSHPLEVDGYRSGSRYRAYIAGTCTAYGHLRAYRVYSDGSVVPGGTMLDPETEKEF